MWLSIATASVKFDIWGTMSEVADFLKLCVNGMNTSTSSAVVDIQRTMTDPNPALLRQFAKQFVLLINGNEFEVWLRHTGGSHLPWTFYH